MFKIYIHGLKDGDYEIHQSVSTTNLDVLADEFFGNVDFKGKMRIIGKRYSITGIAECLAKFECDLSLREFELNIQAEMNCSYLANTELFYLNKNNQTRETGEIVIHEDETYIDLTSEIIEELAVNLPMRRIHPDYEDKNMEDLYPEYSAQLNKSKKSEIDDRWEALKSIKFDKD